MSTAYRHWLLLRMIPRYPRKIDTATVADKMEHLGVTVHRRSIQRDLEKLSEIFPLACDDSDKPYGWSWSADAPTFDIPAMAPTAALAYRMVEAFLAELFPHEVYIQLAPHFRHAGQVLDQIDKPGYRDWPDKVRAISRSQPLLPPKINPRIYEQVSDALLDGQRFRVSYRRRGESEPVTWTVNPLGLVLHDRLLTLVCTIGHYCELKDVRKLYLHRMVEAEPMDEPAPVPEGFSLDEYIDGGAFGFKRGEGMVHLRALFEKDAALHLEETPLSLDQTLTEQTDGRVLVEATVADTEQLRWWLMGFGARVEVVKEDCECVAE